MQVYNPNKNNKVVISGAGPAGLMMACQLSFHNIDFRIIDKKEEVSTGSGAMIIHARSIEIFHQLGLIHKLQEKGRVINAVSVYFNGKKSNYIKLTDTGKGLTLFPYILLLEQSETEQILIEFLRERGHHVEWSTELTGIQEEEQNVRIRLQQPDGVDEWTTAEYLVAADGCKSTIRQYLNISLTGKTHKKPLVLMECDADIISPTNELLFAFSKNATTGFFPLSNGKWRIDAAFRGNNNHRRISFYMVQKVFNQMSGLNVNPEAPQWFSVFQSHGKIASSLIKGRCILLGDAAHQVTPIGGQGMNLGIQDAANLGWKLACVIKKTVAPEYLSTYQEERLWVATKVCRTTDWFFKWIVSDRLWFRMFREYFLPILLRIFILLMKLPPFSNYIFKMISGIGISYPINISIPNAAQNATTGGLRTGQLFPVGSFNDIFLREVSFGGIFNGTKFYLVVYTGEPSTYSEIKKVVSAYDVIEPIEVPFNQETQKTYLLSGIKAQGWILIRPDMYIANRSDELCVENLKVYLQSIFIPRHHEKQTTK